MRFKVVVTNPVFPETIELLRKHCDVDINPSPEPWPAMEVRRRCSDADALLAFMTDSVDAGFLEACPRLKVVACALKAGTISMSKPARGPACGSPLFPTS